MLDLYGALIHLRHTVPEIASGDRGATRVRTGDGWLVMTREGASGGIDVAVCWSDDGAAVPLDGENHQVLLAWEPVHLENGSDGVSVILHEPGIAVLRYA